MQINGMEVTRDWLVQRLEYAPYRSAEKVYVDKTIDVALEYGFCAITLPAPESLAYAAERLSGTGIRLCTVFDHPVGFASSATREAMAKEAVRLGARGADVMPNITAVKTRDWQAVTESIRVIVETVGPDFETKVFTDCNGDPDEMYGMAECIQTAGATHCKTYDANGIGVPISRIADLRRRLSHAKLKASGNGKHWSGIIALGAFAAGADLISGSNMPQIVEELPYVEQIYRSVMF
ncbi:MAG: hypothetical protein LBD12_00225 [Clostridiales Family XIII bacterium]|jgi:deoxyribose-phosphate aldolase|nr:hypothetical protein [Clostridiales Family XIII bacterium]